MSDSIYLHRISHHAGISHPLLENGYLSIGYSSFLVYPDFLQEVCGANGNKKFEQYFEDNWGEKPRSRYNLWRFIAEMKNGDWVLVPTWGAFSIYELTEDSARFISDLESIIQDWHGNKFYIANDGFLYPQNATEDSKPIDLGFIRKVQPIKKGIPRKEYADAALTPRLKVRQSTLNINDLKYSVNNAIHAFENNQPINIYSKLIDSSWKKILDTIKNDLDPGRFEDFVKWYFQRLGASEIYIPAKNERDKEGDADVIAVYESLKTIYYVQVKFHDGLTSKEAIAQIKDYKAQKDAMDDGYSKIGWVISTAESFSQNVYDLAKEYQVQLIDGQQFAVMVLEAGIVNLDKEGI